MFHSLLDATALLIFVGFIYSQLLYRFYRITTSFKVISGILFGIGATVSMYLSITLSHGIILDERSVILSVAACVGGPVTGGVAMVIAVIFRSIIGGPGTLTGILVIITSTFIGWIFFTVEKKRNIKYPFLCALLMGFLVHLAMILIFLTLPETERYEIISRVWFPVLVIFPIATGLLGWFFYEQKLKYLNIKKLKENENLLRLAFLGTRDGIWIWNIDKSIHFDERWDELLGYAKNEIHYTPEWFLSQVHPEDLKNLDEAYENYISGKTDRYDVEYRIRSKSGDWRWIWGIGIATEYDDKGNPVQITGTHRDITDRKNLEERIRKDDERFSVAQEAAKMGTWELDLESGITRWSDTLEKIMGNDSVVDTKKSGQLIRYVHPSDQKMVEKKINSAVKSGSGFEIEHRVLKEDKRIIWILNKGKVIRKNQKPQKIIGIIQDITDRKEAEIRMNNTLRTFKALFDNSLDGIVYSNFNNKYIYGNEAFHKMTGYSEEEMSGKTWYDITPEKWHAIQDEIYGTDLMEKGKSRLFEKEYICKDGSVIPVQLSAALDYDDDKKPIGIWTIVRNISDIKEAYNEIDKSEAKFRTIAYASPVPTYLLDKKATAIFVNQAFCSLTGFSESKLLNQRWKSLLPIENNNKIFKDFKSTTNKNEIFETRGIYIHPDGHKIFWSAKIIPIFSNNELYGYVGMAMDISDQVQAEKKLEEQKKQLKKNIEERTSELELQTKNLEETQKALTYLLEDMDDSRIELEKSNRMMEAAIKELEAFSYSVSHDLRAPLRSINGFGNALLEDYHDKLDETGKDFLRRINRSAERMGQLIEDILQLSRISRAEITSENINISRMCDEILDIVKSQDLDRKINIQIKSGIQVNSDRKLVRIMLENLLGNALKFTRKKKKPKIEVGISNENVDEKEITIYIKDNGTGFDKKYEAEIYAPFKRLHDENEYEGTGIGLATVKRIANRLDVEIWAESELEKGSVFYLKFPDYIISE